MGWLDKCELFDDAVLLHRIPAVGTSVSAGCRWVVLPVQLILAAKLKMLPLMDCSAMGMALLYTEQGG
jgi:hypothetical protein